MAFLSSRATRGGALMLFVTLLGLFTNTPHAVLAAPPATEPGIRVALTDLGYADDIVLSGARPTTSLAFPLPDSGIITSTLALHISVSQMVDPGALLTISLNNQPQLALKVEQLRKNNTVTLTTPPTNERYLTVGIAGNLLDDKLTRCAAAADQSLWMTIGKASALSYQPAHPPTSIRAFLRQPGGTVTVRGMWNTPQQQVDSIALYSTVKYLYRNTPTTVALDGATPAPAAAPATRTIALGSATDTALALADGQLTVAPSRDALRELIQQADHPLLLGSTVSALRAPTPAAQDAARSQLTLRDLGLADQERIGDGVLPTSIRFTLADLGGWPRDLHFHLASAFDQIASNSGERALLRVRLNNTLLDSTDIRGQTAVQRDIALPQELIRPENFLVVEFVYAPQTGDCSGTAYSFNGQIHGGSALSWSGYDTTRHQLASLIGGFRGEGDLFLLDTSAEAARAAAQLFGNLSVYTAEPLLPRLADPAKLAATPSGAYRVIFGGDSATAQTLKLPLDLGQAVTITDPQTKQQVLSGQPNTPLVSAQYLPGSTPTLAVQHSPGTSADVLAAAITRMTDPKNFFALDGDVVVGDADQTVALDLANDTLAVQAAAAPQTWQDVLDRYRWLLIIPAAVIILALWWAVYRRVGQRPPLQIPPELQTKEQAES